MGDRVAVMRDGVLQQCDRPQEIYLRPANTFVAGFVGSPPMNLIRAPVTDDGADLGDFRLRLPREILSSMNGDREVVVGLRPDAFTLAREGGLEVRIGVVEILGSEAYAYGTASLGGDDTQVILEVDPLRPPARGETVRALPKADSAHVFHAISQMRLAG